MTLREDREGLGVQGMLSTMVPSMSKMTLRAKN